MRIFALQTDINVVKEKFLHRGEKEVLFTRYHGFSFFFAIIREILITILLFVLGIVSWNYELPMVWVVSILFSIWLLFVVFNVLRAYIDWNYDFIMVTSDKVVLVDQTSFFRREIKPIHMENIGGVSTETQFWNIFPFGELEFFLKEGEGGGSIKKRFVPHAEQVASEVSDALVQYQRLYG